MAKDYWQNRGLVLTMPLHLYPGSPCPHPRGRSPAHGLSFASSQLPHPFLTTRWHLCQALDELQTNTQENLPLLMTDGTAEAKRKQRPPRVVFRDHLSPSTSESPLTTPKGIQTRIGFHNRELGFLEALGAGGGDRAVSRVRLSEQGRRSLPAHSLPASPTPPVSHPNFT